MFPNARAVLFDFDGTLVRQGIDFDAMRRAVLEVVARYDIATEPLTRMYVLELLDHVALALEAHEPNRKPEFLSAAQQVITAIELDAADGARPFPGVPEMLRQLKAWGFRVGIVTRNCRAAVERVLAREALVHDVLLTRDDVPYVKPDPRHLLAALDALGVSADQAVMCGDHPMDVIVGQRIGAATVGVLTDGLPPDRFAAVEPDLIVSCVTELTRYLGPVC